MKSRWKELGGVVLLTFVAGWCLWGSWRKWPDPIIDSGPQWYNTWRVSLGAVPYRDFVWNYGPLSLLWNGLLFRCFGPGLMTVAVANLVIYAGIVVLAYLAVRKAWGPLAAFAATAIFISVFSFSMLNAVGNYNYVLPYSNETAHGLFIVLLTVFVMVRWAGRPSRLFAFLLGLGGGVAAVLKPEFMLTTGVLGIAAVWLRHRRRQTLLWSECGLILAGVVLPTLICAAWFAVREPWANALVDASQAWWVVFVTQRGPKMIDEAAYLGFNNGWRNVGWELAWSASAALIVGAIWAAGWFINRPWKPVLKIVAALGALALACSVDLGGGFEIGPCFPGLIAAVFVIVVVQWRGDDRCVMALALILVAGTMLARMALRCRINHFGFIQAAVAGIVLTAFLVAEVPRWTGRGRWGQLITRVGILAMLACGSTAIMAESARNHRLQTQPVGAGADKFYAFAPAIDETGAVVNWCADRMRSVSAPATLLVLPEGVMINYLSRHPRPIAEFRADERDYVNQLAQSPPDYVVLIWGDQRDGGMRYFGDPGQPGAQIRGWVKEHYTLADTFHGHTKWAFIFHRKPPSS